VIGSRLDGARMRATPLRVILISCTVGVVAASFNGTISTALASPAQGLSSSSTPASAGVPSTSSGSSGSVLRRFTPLYMGGNQRFTQAQAVAIAHQFDGIAAKSGVFTPYVSSMKAANPSLKLVAYMNGAFDQSAKGTSYPASWYAHDSRGNRIQSVQFHNWLMDPTTSQWGATLAKQCSALITQSKYDGCFLDTLGLGPLLPGYVTGLPVDPRTHKVFSNSAWINAQAANVSTVIKANPAATTVPNGLADGSKYFGGPTEPLLAAAHLAMSEIWLRVSRNSVNSWPSTTTWKQDVDELVNAESHGWGALVVTKLWTNATAAQQDAWHKFTVASFLLGAGGHCEYSFSTAQTPGALSTTSSIDTSSVGSPTGPYSLRNGAYQRTFTSGIVVVNPGSHSVNITFAKSYRSLNGSTVSSETLPPHSGDVLVG